MNLQKTGYLLLLFLSCYSNNATSQLMDTSRVAIHDLGDYYELENGYLGIQIPRSVLFKEYGPEKAPAPFRCMVYDDGWLSSDYENYLQSRTLATSMTDEIIYESEDSCMIRVSYTFDKPELYGGSGLLEPAGPGYYRVTFKMLKGEKACIVTEESDYEVGYRVKVSDGVFPDKGRYIGHHSTSIENGYDPDGNVYNKDELSGWHATVDLDFSTKKDFEPLARWNPFVVNSGWHWQVYDSEGPDYANTFGIFDGKPSLLLGASGSGAGIYIEPSAISNISAACDADGNCHLIWTTENNIFYKKLNVDGTSEPELAIAKNYINPYVFATGNTVNIIAIDPNAPPGGEIRMMKKTGDDPFSYLVPVIDGAIHDPYLYGASTDTHDFMLFEGEHNGEEGLLLYVADHNTTNFTFADILPNGSANREANRPDFRKAPNGDIVLVYTENESYQSFNIIPAGSTEFTTVDQLPLGPKVTFGMAIDPRSGDFFFVDQNGLLHLVELNSTEIIADHLSSITVPQNHGGFDDPNHRSLATDESGNALAYHEHKYYWFDAVTNTWSELTGGGWDSVIPAHVHFNSATQKFNILGKQAGKLSRYTFSGTGSPALEEIYETTARQLTGVKVSHKRQVMTGEYFPDIRFQWCLYADKLINLPPPDEIQPITRTMNRISGLANKVYDYENTPLTFSPSFENGHLYLPASKVDALLEKIKTDEAFYTQLATIDPFYKDVMDAWRDPGSAATDQVYNSILNIRDEIKEALVEGDGIYNFGYMYSSGANRMRRLSDKIAGLLADDKLTVPQRDTLKKCAALFARIIWDDDYVPFFEGHGLNFGTANTPQAYSGQRWFFALIAGMDSEFQQRKASVPDHLQRVIGSQVNGAGATIGTPHYLQPSMDLMVFTALQMKNEGSFNKFTSSDTLRYFADFFLHLLTPPSVRFANNRKLISIGDGSEESAALFGLLASGFAESEPQLSRRLMYAYRNGPARGSDFGFITLAIDFDLEEEATYKTRSGHFPGYLSQIRTGFGTPYESALWLVNGEWYSDHRNDDRGGLSIYALGTPLSLSYGSFYTPHMPGAHQKSAVVPVSMFPQWNQANQPFQLPGNQTWNNSDHQVYTAFKNGGYTRSMFQGDGTWTREVYQFHPHKDLPVFVIKDELTNASSDYIWNFNCMSDGDVGTPAGPVTPPQATWNYISGPTELPSSSQEISLASGLNRFDFQGQHWPAHPYGGIDWEIYVTSSEPEAATLSSFAHVFIPSVEQAEFQATNGMSYEERQTTLRVKGKESFLAAIIPYFKGQRPQNLIVEQLDDTLRITADDFLFETDLSYAIVKSSGSSVFQTLTAEDFNLDSVFISGGAAAYEYVNDTVYFRVHGDTGTRRLRLPPGDWILSPSSPDAQFDGDEQVWLIHYDNTGELVNSFTGGYVEYVFVKDNPLGSDQVAENGILSLDVYPNPSGRDITIKVRSALGGKAVISLIKENGSMVLQRKEQVRQGDNEWPVTLEKLPGGMYLIRVAIGGYEKTVVFKKQ